MEFHESPYTRRVMYRGDSLTIPFQVIATPAGAPAGTSGAPVPIGGWTFWCTLKNNIADLDTQAVIQLKSNSSTSYTSAAGGFQFPSVAQGLGTVTIPPIATIGFPDTPTEVFYDIQGEDVLGNIVTVEVGVIEVYPDITRAIS